MPTSVIGKQYYHCIIEDIYSRKVVNWQVHHNETGEQAAALLDRSVWAKKCLKKDLVLHSDNSAQMKSLYSSSLKKKVKYSFIIQHSRILPSGITG
ncbi:MAG: putative transposase [Colwellia sp.]|jgi:putative transposase